MDTILKIEEDNNVTNTFTERLRSNIMLSRTGKTMKTVMRIYSFIKYVYRIYYLMEWIYRIMNWIYRMINYIYRQMTR